MIPELLAPAGSLEKLEAALTFGADAIYCAGPLGSLRAGSTHLSWEEVAQGLSRAHSRGKRLYLTLNAFPRPSDVQPMVESLHTAADLGVDAVILSDPGLVWYAQEHLPHLPIHLSTQAHTTNPLSVRHWAQMGVERVILARELSGEEIREMVVQSPIPLEIFAHGAICLAYSGRCILSDYFTGRPANKGECAQVCRWHYGLVEEARPGEFIPLEEGPEGSQILSSRDLSLLPVLDEVLALGLASLKIEGRMKSVHYVATVTAVYRAALDAYARDPEGFYIDPLWTAELEKVSHRPYGLGFFRGRPSHGPVGPSVGDVGFVGVVVETEPGRVKVRVRNRIRSGDRVEFLSPGLQLTKHRLEQMTDEEGTPVTEAHNSYTVWIPVDVPQGSLLRNWD